MTCFILMKHGINDTWANCYQITEQILNICLNYAISEIVQHFVLFLSFHQILIKPGMNDMRQGTIKLQSRF